MSTIFAVEYESGVVSGPFTTAEEAMKTCKKPRGSWWVAANDEKTCWSCGTEDGLDWIVGSREDLWEKFGFTLVQEG